jgi:hypothetical protein
VAKHQPCHVVTICVTTFIHQRKEERGANSDGFGVIVRQSSVAAFLVSFSLNCQAIEWVIDSPIGNPSHSRSSDKTLDGHFDNLEHAVSQLKNAALRDGVTIRLPPGKYRLVAPITFDIGKSGGPGAQIALVGPPDKGAIVSGGRVLQHPSSVIEPTVRARLPEKARHDIVRFNLPKEGIGDYGPLVPRGFGKSVKAGQLELYFRGKPMPKARWPNDGYARLQAAGTTGDTACSFRVPGFSVEKLVREPNLLAIGYWAKDWAEETLPVESVNAKTGVITLQHPCPRFGIETGQRVRLENALSELDQPGEWYLDRSTGNLYFWPPSPIRGLRLK